MLTPTGLPSHLAALDGKWEGLLDQLRDADLTRRDVLRAHQIAYARAYIDAPCAQSADALRKQHAIAATHEEGAKLEHWESEVRFIRDELRALQSRTDIARSLYGGIKQATS